MYAIWCCFLISQVASLLFEVKLAKNTFPMGVRCACVCRLNGVNVNDATWVWAEHFANVSFLHVLLNFWCSNINWLARFSLSLAFSCRISCVVVQPIPLPPPRPSTTTGAPSIWLVFVWISWIYVHCKQTVDNQSQSSSHTTHYYTWSGGAHQNHLRSLNYDEKMLYVVRSIGSLHLFSSALLARSHHFFFFVLLLPAVFDLIVVHTIQSAAGKENADKATAVTASNGGINHDSTVNSNLIQRKSETRTNGAMRDEHNRVTNYINTIVVCADTTNGKTAKPRTKFVFT